MAKSFVFALPVVNEVNDICLLLLLSTKTAPVCVKSLDEAMDMDILQMK